MARDSVERKVDRDESRWNRRSYLKLLGATAPPLVASSGATDVARAASGSGFGEGQFGAAGYGGASAEPALAVATSSATDLTDSTATLNAEVTDLGGATSVDVSFEYRISGASSWSATNTQVLTATGGVSTTVTGLRSDTTYEFRVVAAASDGDTATGEIRTLKTRAASTPPAVDQFRLSEQNSPNPHATITASWRVSDADSDLRTVTFDITTPDGRLVSSTTTTVSGGSASGTDSHTIKRGGGATYYCTVTVTDSQSQTVSQTKAITAN